jgi:hypothetical protein
VIDSKCTVIDPHGRSSRANCTLIFKSAVLFEQSRIDFENRLKQKRDERAEAAAKAAAKEKAKPDF